MISFVVLAVAGFLKSCTMTSSYFIFTSRVVLKSLLAFLSFCYAFLRCALACLLEALRSSKSSTYLRIVSQSTAHFLSSSCILANSTVFSFFSLSIWAMYADLPYLSSMLRRRTSCSFWFKVRTSCWTSERAYLHFYSFSSPSLSYFFWLVWIESFCYKAFVIAALGKKNPGYGSSRSALLKLYDCSSLSSGELKLREPMHIN